jgi:hypothetical protein
VAFWHEANVVPFPADDNAEERSILSKILRFFVDGLEGIQNFVLLRTVLKHCVELTLDCR